MSNVFIFVLRTCTVIFLECGVGREFKVWILDCREVLWEEVERIVYGIEFRVRIIVVKF